MTRVWVCRSQLLLALASAVILESESRGTHDHILLSQIRDSSNPGCLGPRIFIPQEEGVPITFPPTTRRATVEILEPASTRGRCKDIGYTFIYTVDLHYITSVTKSSLALWTVAWWIPTNNDISPNSKDGFEKTDISPLGLWRAYRYFPEDTTYAILFMNMVSTDYWNAMKSLDSFLENCHFVFWGP
jgi:hypothetical protein